MTYAKMISDLSERKFEIHHKTKKTKASFADLADCLTFNSNFFFFGQRRQLTIFSRFIKSKVYFLSKDICLKIVE